MSINTINKSKIIYNHKFLFRLFVVSTKLTYSSIKFVLIFILNEIILQYLFIRYKTHKKNVDIKDVDEILQ